MSVPRRFEQEYRVRFDEAGADGVLRNSGYLRFAQDLAWRHSETAGFDRTWYGSRGLHWLVRSIDLDVRAAVPYGSPLTVTTQVIGWRRVWARRLSTFQCAGADEEAARATIDWVLLDEAGRPTRVPTDIADFFADGASFTPTRVTLAAPPPTARVERFRVRWPDVDPMAHVNNAVYLDYLDEGLAVAGLTDGAPLPRRYQVEFLRPARPQAELVASLWEDEAGVAYRLDDDSGEELFRARVATGGADHRRGRAALSPQAIVGGEPNIAS